MTIQATLKLDPLHIAAILANNSPGTQEIEVEVPLTAEEIEAIESIPVEEGTEPDPDEDKKPKTKKVKKTVLANNPETGQPYTDAEWAAEWLCRYCDQQLDKVEIPKVTCEAVANYVRPASAVVIKVTQ